MNDEQQAFREQRRGRFVISTDPSRLDVDFIHDFLAHKSYWAANIPRKVVERSLQNSLCFGLYEGLHQIGLARVITDQATYAWLCDVFVDERYRRQGLGVWLIENVLAHSALQGLRRIALGTEDAHKLYHRFGFAAPEKPQNLMEKRWPNVYQKTMQTRTPPPTGERH